jgi:hypothetical protein
VIDNVAAEIAAREARRYRLILSAVVLLALLAGAFGIGWHYGAGSKAQEAIELGKSLGAETQRANDAAGTVQALKDKLAEERLRRIKQQDAAARALADRDRKLQALEAAAKGRRTRLMDQVTNDEDCAALRDLPVCAPLADGLWGNTAADPH